MIYRKHHQVTNLFQTNIQLICRTIGFFTSTEQLLVQIPILLKHVSQVPTSLHSICMIPVPVDTDTYLGHSNKYNQVHFQYTYIAMSPDSYIP